MAEEIVPLQNSEEQQTLLNVPLFDNKTLASIFSEALNSTDIAQEKTFDIIEQLSELLNSKQDDTKTKLEFNLLLMPLIGDAITQYTQQSESKIKVATAIANILKAKESGMYLNQQFNNQQPEQKTNSDLLNKLKEIDPLAKSFENKKNVVVDNNILENTKPIEDEKIVEPEIIYSPDYKE